MSFVGIFCVKNFRNDTNAYSTILPKQWLTPIHTPRYYRNNEWHQYILHDITKTMNDTNTYSTILPKQWLTPIHTPRYYQNNEWHQYILHDITKTMNDTNTYSTILPKQWTKQTRKTREIKYRSWCKCKQTTSHKTLFYLTTYQNHSVTSLT
jgi:hypothetical protein